MIPFKRHTRKKKSTKDNKKGKQHLTVCFDDVESLYFVRGYLKALFKLNRPQAQFKS